MNKEIDSREQTIPHKQSALNDDDREYEHTGLYPPGEKPFRLVGLLGSLLGVIVFIAAAAVVLDRILIQ